MNWLAQSCLKLQISVTSASGSILFLACVEFDWIWSILDWHNEHGQDSCFGRTQQEKSAGTASAQDADAFVLFDL